MAPIFSANRAQRRTERIYLLIKVLCPMAKTVEAQHNDINIIISSSVEEAATRY